MTTSPQVPTSQEADDLKLTFHRVLIRKRQAVPLSEGSVKAGFPSPAQDYLAGEIDLNDILVRHPEGTFYVRVSGDSMRDAAILDGDLAVVDREVEPRDGDFVIAFLDGEPTIKQFRLSPDGRSGWLQPWNNAYPRIPVTADDDFRIWGVVTHVVHTLHRP